jgi:hypothetical protein
MAKHCDECGRDVTDDQAKPHAVTHWGEDLAEACRKNKDAKARIEKLTGEAY